VFAVQVLRPGKYATRNLRGLCGGDASAVKIICIKHPFMLYNVGVENRTASSSPVGRVDKPSTRAAGLFGK
jgi:hypothetical protein